MLIHTQLCCGAINGVHIVVCVLDGSSVCVLSIGMDVIIVVEEQAPCVVWHGRVVDERSIVLELSECFVLKCDVDVVTVVTVVM